MSSPSRPPPPRRAPAGKGSKSTAVRVVLTIAGASVLGGILALYLVWRELQKELPPVEQLANYQPSVATQVLAADGTMIGEFYFERRYLVPIEKIPPQVRQAFIAAEDSSFYRHRGVDFQGIVRAFLYNVLAGAGRAGRQHDHAAGREVAAAHARAELRAQGQGDHALAPPRAAAHQGRDPLPLSEPDLSRRTARTASPRRRTSTSARTSRSSRSPRRRCSPACRRRRAAIRPVRHSERAQARASATCSSAWYEERYIDQATREEAHRASRSASPATAGPTYRAAPLLRRARAPRCSRTRYGGRAPYQAGLNVHTAVDLAMQRAAEEALRAGLEGDRPPARLSRAAPQHLERRRDPERISTPRERMLRDARSRGRRERRGGRAWARARSACTLMVGAPRGGAPGRARMSGPATGADALHASATSSS